MTLGILVLLCRQLPDFFVRSLLWLRSWGRYRLRVVGGNNMPVSGPVILATNCTHVESCLQVLSITDRFTRFVLLDNHEERPGPFLRLMARLTSLAVLRADKSGDDWHQALDRAVAVLDEDEVVGLPATGGSAVHEVDDLLQGLEKRHRAVIVPVYCGKRSASNGELQRVKVIIGKPLPPETPAELVRKEIEQLSRGAEAQDSRATVPAR
jgi:1-acyl-sn-glycerol-3-phosphate acyltransferase